MYKIVITDHFKIQLKKLLRKDKKLKESFKETVLSFNKSKAISIGMGGIYAKANKENLSKQELTQHLEIIKTELDLPT